MAGFLGVDELMDPCAAGASAEEAVTNEHAASPMNRAPPAARPAVVPLLPLLLLGPVDEACWCTSGVLGAVIREDSLQQTLGTVRVGA